MTRDLFSAAHSHHRALRPALLAALCGLGALALSSCSQTQLTQAEQDANAALSAVTQACAGAEAAKATAAGLAKGGAAATVANVGAYVDAACGTSAAIIAVAQNPTTAAWLNGLNESLNAAVATAPAAPAGS